jgi:hypothetical protein
MVLGFRNSSSSRAPAASMIWDRVREFGRVTA